MSITSGIDSAPLMAEAPRYTVEATYLDRRSLSFQARRRRFAHVRRLIDRVIQAKGSCRIADIGGTAYYWTIAGDYVASAPLEIHLINLDPAPGARDGKFVFHTADACTLDRFDDQAFDLVHSNSVIEHVGSWERMALMASHVRRLAPSYYVQTPNFWFPYEPHFRFPLFQMLPESIRCRLLMRFNLGFGGRRQTVDAAMRAVQSSNLLDATQMRALFPDAHLLRERIGPLTKSLMAVRERD